MFLFSSNIFISRPALPLGKSYFAVYVLLMRLASGNEVMFNNKAGMTYWFHRQCVWRRATVSIKAEDLDSITYNPAQRVWSLFDPPNGKKPIDNTLINSARIFYAVFASPDATRFTYLAKEHALRWLLSPWDNYELGRLCVSSIFNDDCV